MFDDLIRRTSGVSDGQLRAGNDRTQEASHRLGFFGCQCRVDDHREPISLAAVIRVAKHREVIGWNAAIPQIDRR